MQEHEVRELMDRLLEAMDPALEYEARHEDYVVEFPQSGERMDRDGLRAMQDAYPDGPPKIACAGWSAPATYGSARASSTMPGSASRPSGTTTQAAQYWACLPMTL